MASEHLGPAHPCLGCQFKGPVTVTGRYGRELPARRCQHPHGQPVPLVWGDELPTWCPGKVTK